MARLEPNAPVYAFPQPDGTSITLDLSIRDGFCDFAMEMTYGDGKRRQVSVYHTGEPKLFIEILHCWTHAATPTEILTSIDWVRDELEATTSGRAAPASLLGFASWLSGHGALAWCGLDKVPKDKPYALANLVAAAVQTRMHPREWETVNGTTEHSAENAADFIALRPAAQVGPARPAQGL